MRGGKLKELAAYTAGKAISSSNSSVATVESLSSVFLATLKKTSPVPAKEKFENLRVAEVIATRKRPVSSPFGSGPRRGSGLGATEKKPSKPPIRISQEALSVLKEAGEEKGWDTSVGGETGSLKLRQAEETANGSMIENSFHDTHNIFKSQKQKEKSRERKAQWIHKNTQDLRFSRLIKRSADTLGTESTLEVLGKLGKDTGVKEYNALIGICIDKARQNNDEDSSLVQLQKAFQIIKSMKEQGFQIEEGSYGPLLMYLIEMEMIEEFQNISEVIKDESPQSNSRICYYEMLLWIRIGDEEQIGDACNSLQLDDNDSNFCMAENYLLALCENDRKNEILGLLRVLDIKSISSPKYVSAIFKSLGRQSLGNVAMEFILALKSADENKGDISSLIFDYTSNVPNHTVTKVTIH